MTSALREVFIAALQHWRVLFHEEERNLFRIEVEAGSAAAAVFESDGTLHVGLEVFEDDVVAAYARWRSVTPGSYYLHRLLEYLRSLPAVGMTAVAPAGPSPPAVPMLQTGTDLGSAVKVTDARFLTEVDVATFAFRFFVRVVGIEPVSQIVSVVVESRGARVLSPPKLEEAPVNGQPAGQMPRIGVEQLFDSAAESLREDVVAILGAYRRARQRETRLALQRIRSAELADLRALDRQGRSIDGVAYVEPARLPMDAALFANRRWPSWAEVLRSRRARRRIATP